MIPEMDSLLRRPGGVARAVSEIRGQKKERKRKLIADQQRHVKKYRDLYDAASTENDMVDEMWRDVGDRYKKLAKTKIGRVIKVARGKGSDVQDYKKRYDAASEANDRVDKMWDAAMDEYVKTGRNAIERIIRNR